MRDLVSLTWTNVRKCPKSTRFIYQTKLCEIVENAYFHLITVNSIKVKTEGDRQLRRNHLFEALGLINSLEALLSIVQDNLEKERSPSGKRYINVNSWKVWGDLIDKERSLVLGVIKQDKGNVS